LKPEDVIKDFSHVPPKAFVRPVVLRIFKIMRRSFKDKFWSECCVQVGEHPENGIAGFE
jgi:hypothetical protein